MKLKTMSKSKRSDIITYGMVFFGFLIIQGLISKNLVSNLLQGLLVPMCAYVVLALSLNLVVGILGELSLGHAGFMCIGAFVGASFTKITQQSIANPIVRIFLAFVIGSIVAGIFGLIIAVPVLRLKGDYLAIVTLAFGEIIKNVFNSLYLGIDKNGIHISLKNAADLHMAVGGKKIINGAMGIIGIPKVSTFAMGFILIIITLFVILNLIKSRDGRAIMAIRDNAIAAESIGINLTKYKLKAFTISAALAGAAGVLYAHNLSTITANPKTFGYTMSILILVFVVLGGIGSMRGSIVAAVLLTVLPELLRGLNDYRMLIYAIVLIAMMLINWSPKAIEFRQRYSIKKLIKPTGEV